MTDITLGKIERASTGGTLFESIGHQLRRWQRRLREREDLARMTERDLRDIGMSSAQAEYEAAKPFWRG